jgi:hypothetical protein
MKILFIYNYKIFKDWASKTYEYKINEIIKNENFDSFDIDNIDENLKIENYSKIILGWNTIPISKYYTLKHDFYKKKVNNLESFSEFEKKISKFMNIPEKYLIIQDFNCHHDYKNGLIGLVEYLKEKKINNLITPYYKNEGIKFIKSKIKKINIIHLPHHINNNYFKNYNLEKKYDIFIFGNISPKFYPFRHRLYNLLIKNKDKFNVKILNGFRNYFRFNEKVSNQNLSKIINRSWITICTSSKFNLLLGKYIETAMSNSVICGDIPTDGIHTFKNNIIEINEKMSDNEIITIISNNLNNKDKLNKLSNVCQKKMESYKLKDYSNKLFDLIIN